MAISKFELTIDSDNNTFSIVSIETGEVQTVDLPKTTKKSTRKTSSKKDEDPNPKIILEENKYILNQAAADLMEVSPDDKIELKFMKEGKQLIPTLVIGDKGNRLTKSLTVSCRGSNHEELVKFGTEFVPTAHSTKNSVFVLNGNIVQEIPEGDENIAPPENDDLNLDGLLSDNGVDSFDFTL